MDKTQDQLLLPLSSSIPLSFNSSTVFAKQVTPVFDPQCTVIDFQTYLQVDKQIYHQKELEKQIIEYANKFDW